MESVPEEKYVFDAQWYQSEASVTRDFILNFYIEDNSLELVKNLEISKLTILFIKKSLCNSRSIQRPEKYS